VNWTGLILGLFSMLAIGLGFVWVIRFEYLVGAYRWKWVMAAGALVCFSSLFAPNFLVSALLGITGGSIMWGSVELPHQEERVDHGLFKAHPARAGRPRVGHGDGAGHPHGSKPGLGKWWSF
jgi:hypothetical protein